MGLSKEIIDSIKEIIKEYKYNFKLFGSRARGDYKNSSDIDIAIFKDVTEADEYKIKNQFDLLDIPYTIDLVFINNNTRKELLDSIIKEGIDL